MDEGLRAKGGVTCSVSARVRQYWTSERVKRLEARWQQLKSFPDVMTSLYNRSQSPALAFKKGKSSSSRLSTFAWSARLQAGRKI